MDAAPSGHHSMLTLLLACLRSPPRPDAGRAASRERCSGGKSHNNSTSCYYDWDCFVP
ncbi:hypothetical protein VTJ49DRAFT_6700 [Mycothermus thermophilus]|uniref:Uncharacterized protein n=1 Tax=Humicola insolens TaxID=85995 RepID=A0ABR3V103_HUMIN